jgi:hypothetical protein
MIYRLILFIGLFFLLTGETNAQLDKSILKKISKYQKEGKDVLGRAKGLKYTREMLSETDSLSFINQKVDTVFLLEMFDIETGRSYGSIWNKCKTLDYTCYYRDTLEFQYNTLFTKHMRELVSTWDIEGIRKEEESDSKPVSPNDIYATRIIIGNKTKVDFFTFNEFSDLWINASE